MKPPIMKNITIILVSIAFIGLLLWSGYKNSSSTASVQGVTSTGKTSALTVTNGAAVYDFGTISMKNDTVTTEFTVTNQTNETILVPSLVTSCMCTKAFIVSPDGSTKGPFGMSGMGHVPPADETIVPGESRIIRVVYDPNAHGPAGVGKIDRFITLTDAAGGTLTLEIKALVTP
jgi:hypothetical protein